MQRLLLAVGALLISTSAIAGGIYNESATVPASTNYPNVPVTLWTQNIAGGAISANNAMRIHLRVSAIGDSNLTGSFQVKYGSQVLADIAILGPDDITLDLIVTRTGNHYGTVVGTLGYFYSIGYPLTFSDSFIGTYWTSQNAVSIVGVANQTGGVLLQEVGLER